MDRDNIDTQQSSELHHVATGGTIDSHWSPSDDTSITNEESIVPDYLNTVRLPRHHITSETICLEDSRKIGISLQDQIAARIAESTHRRILVTSGTYLMPDIANAVLAHPATKRFQRMGKRVVVTGSGIPIKNFMMSDGGFNLGMGTAVLQEDVESLVSLTMSGMCLDVASGVRKDLTKATFSSGDAKHDILDYDGFTLIPAGGSMDFELDGLDGLVPSKDSAIPSYFRDEVQIQRDFDAVNPCVKDSRDLQDEDLGMILDVIRDSTSENILVTLGMYKLREIQGFLRDNLEGDDKDRKVMLTASRLPLRVNDMTDATFNLGYALGKIAFVRDGVHIALNGMLLDDGDDIVKLIYTREEQDKLKKNGGFCVGKIFL